MTLREILSRRDAIRTELRSLIDKHADGNLPDEARGRADELEAEAERLTAAERRQVLIDELDRRAAGTPLTGSGDVGFEALAAQVNILDVIRAQMGDASVASGRAREVSAELERRSGRKADGLFYSMARSGRRPEQRVFTTTMPTPGGGALIQTDVGPLIDRLRERLVIKRLGATVLGGLEGNLSIPRLKTSATGYWVAENAALTLSDPVTEAVPMSPKHVGGLVEVSRNMLQQSSVDVVMMIENDLAQVIAVAIDRAAVKGGGSNEPKGLLDPSSGINTASMGGSALDWDDVIDMVSEVDVANALAGSLAFLTGARLVAKLRKTQRTTTDTASNFLMNDAATLAGFPLASSQVVASQSVVSEPDQSSLIFGDWSMLVIGYWSELDILVNPYAEVAYSKGNVQVRCMSTCDIAIKQPLAFSARTSVALA
jgi:HK97 family phage major capsid protein